MTPVKTGIFWWCCLFGRPPHLFGSACPSDGPSMSILVHAAHMDCPPSRCALNEWCVHRSSSKDKARDRRKSAPALEDRKSSKGSKVNSSDAEVVHDIEMQHAAHQLTPSTPAAAEGQRALQPQVDPGCGGGRPAGGGRRDRRRQATGPQVQAIGLQVRNMLTHSAHAVETCLHTPHMQSKHAYTLRTYSRNMFTHSVHAVVRPNTPTAACCLHESPLQATQMQ